MSFVDQSKVKYRITTWSYSRLKTWEKCPAQAKYKFCMRLPEPDSIYASRGTEIHKYADAFIKGEAPKETLNKVVKLLEPYRVRPGDRVVSTERQQGLTKDWTFTGWFGNDTWLRVIYDLHAQEKGIVDIVDHKTGKVYEDEHADQRDLYTTSAMADPTVEESRAVMIYIDQGSKSKVTVLTRKDFKARQEYWNDRAAPMLADDIFAPSPNPGCRWCHYRKSNGGPCQFG